MDAVVEIAKLCVQKPISLAFKEVGYVMGKKSLIKSLEKMKTAIQAWLVDANSAHLTSQAQRLAVEQLICELDELRDLLDVIATRKLIISTNCGNNFLKKVLTWLSSPSLNPVVSSFRDVRRIRAFIEELASIATPHSQLGSMLRLPVETAISSRRALCLETGPLSSEIVIGRDVDRDNIISLLIHSASGLENCLVVSIVGIGGMGKTTLAQYVFSDERVQKHFDVSFWVHVPQELVAKDVMRKMVELATEENINETTQLTQLQYRLHPIISSKKCLLVIDNIWDHNLNLSWPILMQQLGFGGRGSMVLTTTRSLRVAKTIGNVAPYMLGDLEDDDSWSLFKIHAFRHAQDQEFDVLEVIGKEIVQMCPNVPLVIQCVGCHLGGHSRTISKWEEFRDKLCSLSRFNEVPDVLETLKLTYDDLDYWLKRCFACFSLFPKGYEFSESELIYLWIALELVEIPSDKSKSLVDVAKYYIHCLKEEGLVSSPKKMVTLSWEKKYEIKMHDVIHDLALSIIDTSKYKMVDSERQEVEEMIQHISFTKNAKLSGNFPCSSILKMKKQMQSLFLLQERFGDGVKLKLKGMSGFEHLRVLGLQKAGLEEVPRTIGELQLLRYLDLSGNPEIKKLPSSITKLVNLVYLNLDGCKKLEELPVDLNKLQKLIYLDLRNCGALRKLPIGITKLVNLRELRLEGCSKLRHMPLGMRNMSALKRLDLFVANESNFDYDEMGGLAELNCLNNLEEDLTIKVFGSSSEAMEANLRGKKKLTKLVIDFLWGSNREHHEMMLEGFQPHTNLKILEIDVYGGGRLPSWIDDMLSLEEIRISNWEVGHICVGSLGRLPCLKALSIEWCVNIESFSTTPSNSSSGNYELGLEVIPEDFRGGFPSLQLLAIWNCKQLKELPEWIDTLTSLKQLKIRECPELRSLPKQMAKLSNLETLHIENCPNFKGIQTDEDEGDIPCFPKLKSLNLIGLGLEFVPDMFKGVSSLQLLQIVRCKQLKELPEWIDTLTSLKELEIKGCPELRSLPKQMAKLSNLEDLEIRDCPNLKDIQTDEDEDIACFPKLKYLFLEKLGLEFVPNFFKGLFYLNIEKCQQLKELPEWIDTFTSLYELYITDCPNLTSLPKQMANLKNLQSLSIRGNSWELQERCQKITGQDWHLIQHVPRVDIAPI